MPANNLNHLVGTTTRYIAGRKALQTSYWRASADGKLIKYSKTCEFDRSQEIPASIRHQFFNRSYVTNKSI
ncbi:uncharacterized protein LOC119631852 [Glossina fuscipes]|uniref:Uncharacterized protein LOC119631852 n=2 Tax=Nemorhina TaxID=44051 RepID=A0A8U0W541_9MUSC|nr:uncharacterized protein LOC119631852 [Glossina fuscipes]